MKRSLDNDMLRNKSSRVLAATPDVSSVLREEHWLHMCVHRAAAAMCGHMSNGCTGDYTESLCSL